MAESSTSEDRRPPVSRRRRWAFRLLALLLVVALLELGSFIAVRMLAREPNPIHSETHLLDAHRNHRLNPHFRQNGQPLHSADGLRRDLPLPLAKPPKTFRIVVLGTSAVYGIGANAPYPEHPPLNNDQTIPHRLQVILQQYVRHLGDDGGWQVEVINGGVSAYKTFHHLIHLNSRLLDYSPDVVINVDGHNDFYFSRLTDRWNEYAYSTSVLVDEFNGRSIFLPFFTFNRSMSRYSNVCNLLERINRRQWQQRVAERLANTPIRDLPGKDELDQLPLEERVEIIAKQQYLRDLWQIHQLGKREGYDHMVFLQPEVIFEDPELLTKSDLHLQQLTEQYYQKGQIERMKKIRKLFPKLFKDAKIPFHDVAQFTDINPIREAMYIDYCHLSPEGANALANEIARRVFQVLDKRMRK